MSGGFAPVALSKDSAPSARDPVVHLARIDLWPLQRNPRHSQGRKGQGLQSRAASPQAGSPHLEAILGDLPTYLNILNPVSARFTQNVCHFQSTGRARVDS